MLCVNVTHFEAKDISPKCLSVALRFVCKWLNPGTFIGYCFFAFTWQITCPVSVSFSARNWHLTILFGDNWRQTEIDVFCSVFRVLQVTLQQQRTQTMAQGKMWVMVLEILLYFYDQRTSTWLSPLWQLIGCALK